MELESDPNTRHRLDGQEMLERDERVARLREQGVPFRVIAVRLGCSLGSVQKAVRRVQARRAERVLAAAADVDDQPVGAVRFVGVDEVDLRVELFADERGRRFNLLDLYRHTRIDGGVLFGDACRQLDERHG
jgi:lambda repressor-like predicted transcriptional regulator